MIHRLRQFQRDPLHSLLCLTHLTPHVPHRLLQPRDLLALVSLLFLDFVDCSPEALKLSVLLGPIRLREQAELPIPRSQLPLEVRNR
jgi:hypothetical protein